MNEDAWIRRIEARIPVRARASSRKPGLMLGIGDDAAIYRPAPGEDLVFTTDMMIEERHFLREYPADSVGWKALCRSLSDIAAMGASPRFALLSLAVAPWVKPAWVDGFYDGFLALAAKYKVLLAGGDLSRAARASIDVMVCGAVPAGEALRRGTARAGDTLYVSGALGGASLGLRSGRSRSATGRAARERHLRPEPRVALGNALRRRGIASAAMDLSDGLSSDLARLARASGLAARLQRPLPVFPGASESDALHGGDDYELLFAAPSADRIPGRIAGQRIARVGQLIAGEPGRLFFEGEALLPAGWDPFAK
ncbi:MAG: thiamine-phosphate kinase [Bryobacterales bacterium]|nr:thiamine-phosphate kinase [Bryobacterales bacterium]